MEGTAEPTMQAFFEAFETSSEAGDAAILAKLYAESFLVASANGVQVVKASDLAHIIPKRKQMLDAAGCQAAKLVSLNETRLDDRYSMVRTEWRWRLKSGEGKSLEITLPSTYIVRRRSSHGENRPGQRSPQSVRNDASPIPKENPALNPSLLNPSVKYTLG